MVIDSRGFASCRLEGRERKTECSLHLALRKLRGHIIEERSTLRVYALGYLALFVFVLAISAAFSLWLYKGTQQPTALLPPVTPFLTTATASALKFSDWAPIPGKLEHWRYLHDDALLTCGGHAKAISSLTSEIDDAIS